MRLELKSFMSHNASTIEFPARGVVLVGGPNGAGKSAIVEAVSTAMWGRGLRGRWSPWRPDEAGRVVLDDAGLNVCRSWTGKSKGLRWKRDGDAIDFDTTTKAQESLEAIVGPFEVWRRTSVFSAADAAHFTMATDAERKELLEALLGLGWFDKALALCRQDLRSVQTLAGQAERDRSIAEAKISSATTALERAQELLGELSEHHDVGLARAEAAQLNGHLRDVGRELAELNERRSSLLAAGGADKARAEALELRLSKLKDSSCYACGQAVSNELRKTMRAEVQAGFKASAAKVEEVGKELESVRSTIEELEEEARGLRNLIDKVRDEIAKASATTDHKVRLERSIKSANEEAQQYQAQASDAATRAAALAVDLAELEACERVLGVRGARAHVVGRTLSGIEGLANGWLSKLSSQITLQLRPYTEKKSGGHVDAISLTLTGAGGESGYAGASAGERRRVDVALLLALAELASSTHNGASWQSPIFFDEVFDSLDADGRDAVGELVQELAVNRCVVLITHDESVASIRADLRLRIDGGRVA